MRPPSATPAEDSTNVVTVEVPQTAAAAGGDGVSQHGLVHVGDVAFLGQHVAGRAGAVQRAKGIEHIDHAECKHGGEEHNDEVAHAVLGNVRAEVEAFGEDLAERLCAELLECTEEIGGQVGSDSGSIEIRNRDEADDVVENCAAEHTPQNSALDLLLGHCADGEDRDDGQDHREDVGPCRGAGEDVEGREIDERCAVVHDDTGVLQADERDEQADTGGDRGLDSGRDGVKDHLAQAGDGQQDEDDAVNQNENQRVCVAQAEGEADGVDEECVQAHAGRLRQRQVGQQTDENGADDGGDGGRDVDRAVADSAEAGEHTGVDHQNVGHCHEGRYTGHDLGAHGRAVFLHFKEIAHVGKPSFLFSRAGKSF